MRSGYQAVGVVWLLTAGLAATCAQTPAPALTTEQQQALRDVALGKARSALLDQLRELPLRPGVALADWLTRDVALDRALRQWVRTRPAEGEPRLYSDGVCEVDARVSPDDLQAELLKLIDDYPDAATAVGLDAAGLKAAAQRWPVLWATGSAARSKELWPGQPLGWENVTREGQELARGAAGAVAYEALLAEAGRLKVTNARRLREFLDSSPAVRDAVRDEVKRAAALQLEFAPDQVVVAEARLSMRDLLHMLTRVHQEQYRGDDFTAADFREMALLAEKEELTGSGLATPPARTVLRTGYPPIEYNAPAWASATLAAIGRHLPVGAESSDAAARRAAARLDGIDRLRVQVEQLVIQKNVTVAEFLGYHQDLKDDVTLFLSAARVTGAPQTRPDGGVERELSLPLRRLWEIVRRKMTLEEVAPPAESAPASAPTTAPTTAPAAPAAPASRKESP